MTRITHICARFALAFSALLIPMALVGPPAYADGTPVRVRGSVVSLDGSKLIVRAKDGKDVSVSLADNFAALAVVKAWKYEPARYKGQPITVYRIIQIPFKLNA